MSAVLEDLLRTKAAEAMDLEAYVGLFEQVVVEGRTTGPVQTEDYVAYTKLNLARWRRVQKTMELVPGAGEVLRGTAPLTWLVISEPWCGDAAQVVPVLATMAAQMPGSELRLVLRDEQPELMDRYLTNGGRSIPKLIAMDRESGAERFSWGPRPQGPRRNWCWPCAKCTRATGRPPRKNCTAGTTPMPPAARNARSSNCFRPTEPGPRSSTPAPGRSRPTVGR
jgi:hypothetical protein